MTVQPDILSVRMRNRATLLRMLAAGEAPLSDMEARAELRCLADQLERDAEAAMALEIRRARTR
jgi:hypothetical protein